MDERTVTFVVDATGADEIALCYRTDAALRALPIPWATVPTRARVTVQLTGDAGLSTQTRVAAVMDAVERFWGCGEIPATRVRVNGPVDDVVVRLAWG